MVCRVENNSVADSTNLLPSRSRVHSEVGVSAEFYSVRMPLAGEWLLVRNDEFARITDTSAGQIRAVSQHGGAERLASFSEVFWHPRGYWKRFDPDAPASIRRADVMRRRTSVCHVMCVESPCAISSMNDVTFDAEYSL